MRENQPQFGSDALRADDDQLRGLLLDRSECGVVDRKIKPSSEADGPQHPQLVLGNAGERIADRADDTALDIRLPANEVDDLVVQRVVEQAVNREIAPLGIVLGIGKGNGVRMAAVAISRIAAERG